MPSQEYKPPRAGDRRDLGHSYKEPERRMDCDRPRLIPCRFCPATVDREPLAAARHLLFSCRSPSLEALEVARRVVKEVPA